MNSRKKSKCNKSLGAADPGIISGTAVCPRLDAMPQDAGATGRITSLTLCMSSQTSEQIWDEAVKFADRISELVSVDKHADRLYLYQLMLVPVSGHNDDRSGGREK